MEHADIEVLLDGEMRHTGDERLPERPIIGPFREDSVDCRVMDGRFALGVLRYGHALPLHPCIEDPHDEVEDAMRAEFARGSALGHGEVREDTLRELRCGELDGNRRRCGFCWRWRPV